MDKYERRRQRLMLLKETKCNGKIANLARAIEREPSYVSRMLYPEGKPGKKRIADDMVEIIEGKFGLPPGWLSLELSQDPNPNPNPNPAIQLTATSLPSNSYNTIKLADIEIILASRSSNELLEIMTIIVNTLKKRSGH